MQFLRFIEEIFVCYNLQKKPMEWGGENLKVSVGINPPFVFDENKSFLKMFLYSPFPAFLQFLPIKHFLDHTKFPDPPSHTNFLIPSHHSPELNLSFHSKG